MSFKFATKITVAAVAVIGFATLGAATASAHVTVKPNQVPTASYQTFTVSVPNEKDIPTTAVRIVIPEGVTGVTPTQKSGWEIETKKADQSENAAVTEITWKGGEVNAEQRDEFSFSAKTPAKAGNLQWKAYQTYSDGVVVAWGQAAAAGGGHDALEPNKGPFSVTVVSADEEDGLSVKTTQVQNAQSKADRATYIAIGALVVALIAVFFATRSRKS